MRQDVHSVADQFRAVAADVFAVPHVLIGKFLRRCQCERLLLINRLTGTHGLPHASNRVQRINGGGSCGFESGANGFQVSQEFRPVVSTEGARTLGEAVGRGGPNRTGAANDHVFDGPRCLPEIVCRDYLEFVRQEPLLDEQDSILPGVKCYRPEMTGSAMECDFQAISTLIFRILLSMSR
jgi:hypothetical protein